MYSLLYVDDEPSLLDLAKIYLLSALKQYYRFLLSEGRRQDDPTRLLAAPPKKRQLPKTLKGEEVERLLDAARAIQGPRGLRLVALLELLYATGLRVSELISVPEAAIARDPEVLVVEGKGGNERLVPLHEAAREAIIAYRSQRQVFLRKGQPSRWLFPSHSKEGHLTRQQIGLLLKDLALAAGLDPGRPTSQGRACLDAGNHLDNAQPWIRDPGWPLQNPPLVARYFSPTPKTT